MIFAQDYGNNDSQSSLDKYEIVFSFWEVHMVVLKYSHTIIPFITTMMFDKVAFRLKEYKSHEPHFNEVASSPLTHK